MRMIALPAGKNKNPLSDEDIEIIDAACRRAFHLDVDGGLSLRLVHHDAIADKRVRPADRSFH